MSAAAWRHRSYRWRGGTEWLAEVGEGPPILFAPPLLEEMNRCRALVAAIMRRVAEAGFHAVLPDLPGTGESPRELGEVDWEDWTGALGLLSFDLKVRSQTPLLVGFRGGCLTEEKVDAAATWRFAPAAGDVLVRDLIRAKQASLPNKARAEVIAEEARSAGGEFAGYHVPAALFMGLSNAVVPTRRQVRTVRLASDAADADLKVEGRPLWRQAEPGIDPALSASLGDDIATWARACVG